MRKIVSIGIAAGALAVAVLPVRADDQAIGFATGRVGGFARAAQADNPQARAASGQHGAIERAVRSSRASSEAYAGFARSGAYVQTCSHVGGPKVGSWTCR